MAALARRQQQQQDRRQVEDNCQRERKQRRDASCIRSPSAVAPPAWHVPSPLEQLQATCECSQEIGRVPSMKGALAAAQRNDEEPCIDNKQGRRTGTASACFAERIKSQLPVPECPT